MTDWETGQFRKNLVKAKMYKNSDNTSLDLKFKYCEKATKLLKNLFFNININDIVMSKLSERFSKSLGPSQNILIFQWPTLSDFLSCDRFSILSQFFLYILCLGFFFYSIFSVLVFPGTFSHSQITYCWYPHIVVKYCDLFIW